MAVLAAPPGGEDFVTFSPAILCSSPCRDPLPTLVLRGAQAPLPCGWGAYDPAPH